jgi:hypothetical protein
MQARQFLQRLSSIRTTPFSDFQIACVGQGVTHTGFKQW